jgi:GTPase SAR1 family protein
MGLPAWHQKEFAGMTGSQQRTSLHLYISLTASANSRPCWKSLPLPGRAAYYRGAQGIIFVYDVTRRETFESLADIWMREVDMYSTVEDAVKMVVANKTDLVSGSSLGNRQLDDRS